MKNFLFVFSLIVFFCLGVQIFSAFNSVQSNDCLMAGRGYYARNHFRQYTQISDNNRRGCCSRHGGVCGCSGGHSKCCDGTLSPTCQCFMDENKGMQL